MPPFSKRPALLVALLLIASGALALSAEPKKSFVAGVNYPWIAYGHDFGKNGWGHDGLITGGWSYQTYFNSQGFVDARFSRAKARSGAGSLRITADMTGQHPNESQGEVYLDLRTHTPAGVSVPVDLRHSTVSCWLYLPPGSAGDASAPNGIQFFFKSEGLESSLYSAHQNLRRDREERWVQFTADMSADGGGDVDDAYDPTKVITVGLKINMNGQSQGTLAGEIFVDDYAIGPAPAIAFDFEKLEVETDFAALQQALGNCSVPAVRVFVFADGRASPEFAFGDQVTGLDEYFFEDFDALLEAAGQYGLMVIPVLLDFHWFDTAGDGNSGVQLGGRSGVVRNTVRRKAFLENAVAPLVERYCGHPRIMAWDIINEPEWATNELGDDSQAMDPVALAEMQEFVRLAAETIHHSCAGQKVTVGSARRMWLQYWSGLGLDLYQFHWYDHFSSQEPFPWLPYAQLALDKPALVGEVPTARTSHATRDYLLTAAGAGYEGLLVWSFRAGDDRSEYGNARSMLESWCDAIPRRRSIRSAGN